MLYSKDIQLQRKLKKKVATKDQEWALEVKRKAGFKCEKCNDRKILKSHHVITKGNKAVRWDVDNGVCLCRKHHTVSSSFSAHKTPKKFKKWIIEKRGEGWYNKLKKRSIKIKGL